MARNWFEIFEILFKNVGRLVKCIGKKILFETLYKREKKYVVALLIYFPKITTIPAYDYIDEFQLYVCIESNITIKYLIR